MRTIIVVLLLTSFFAVADLNGPAAASQSVLSTNSLRFELFKKIMAYIQAQEIYDIVEHYSYLQNLDKSNLTLTRRQRKDLLKFVERYYDISNAIHHQTPLSVTCQAPSQPSD